MLRCTSKMACQAAAQTRLLIASTNASRHRSYCRAVVVLLPSGRETIDAEVNDERPKFLCIVDTKKNETCIVLRPANESRFVDHRDDCSKKSDKKKKHRAANK